MIKVSEKLFRGSRPESFQDLCEEGISLVINLQSGAHEFFKDDKYEFESAAEFGIIELNLKCGDVFAPSAEEVSDFLDAINSHSGKAYVHCLHGKDRTGFMCAIYRMKVQGWTFEESIKEMFDLGFHKVPYIFWLKELKKYK